MLNFVDFPSNRIDAVWILFRYYLFVNGLSHSFKTLCPSLHRRQLIRLLTQAKCFQRSPNYLHARLVCGVRESSLSSNGKLVVFEWLFSQPLWWWKEAQEQYAARHSFDDCAAVCIQLEIIFIFFSHSRVRTRSFFHAWTDSFLTFISNSVNILLLFFYQFLCLVQFLVCIPFYVCYIAARSDKTLKAKLHS